MGLGHTLVKPNSQINLRVQSQVGFHPDLLVIPAEVFETCDVKAVRCVGENVLDANGKVEVTQFSTSLSLIRSELQHNDWFVIEIENRTSSTKAFYGTVVGDLGER